MTGWSNSFQWFMMSEFCDENKLRTLILRLPHRVPCRQLRMLQSRSGRKLARAISRSRSPRRCSLQIVSTKMFYQWYPARVNDCLSNNSGVLCLLGLAMSLPKETRMVCAVLLCLFSYALLVSSQPSECEVMLYTSVI